MGSECNLHSWSTTREDLVCPYCQNNQDKVEEYRAAMISAKLEIEHQQPGLAADILDEALYP